MKCKAKLALLLLSVAAIFASAQSTPESHSQARETQTHAFWIDPSTGLMWATKDNGKDVSWHKAVNYCRDSRLGGFSSWRLATIDELQGIYNKSAEAPGMNPATHWHKAEAMTYHVKGNLFLTGDAWSSSQRLDDRGRPSGLVWYFDFVNGWPNQEDGGLITGRGAGFGMRALCVRYS